MKEQNGEKSTLKRRDYILQVLKTGDTVQVVDVSKRFSVSEVTVRKDLEQLEKKNLLLKVRGGAIRLPYKPAPDDLAIRDKQQKNLAEKQRIGKAAAALILPGDTIILDSGTTTSEIAKNLNPIENLSIITNALNIASLLVENNKFSVIVPGGFLRHKSSSLVGPSAEAFLNNFYCDKLFLGVDSFNLEKGVSTPDIDEASMNRAMINSAREVIAVFDSSKFEKRSFALIAPVTSINTIVTDDGIPKDIKEKLEKLGIKVIIA
jgi:DeoR family transcriptional regulator of aga operon